MIKTITGLLLVVMLTAVAATAVFAHDDSEEGDYKFVVGFLREPAYEGERNAVSIRVSLVAAGDQREEKTTPVEGLQSTLQVEVTHVPSDVSRLMSLRTVHGEPGHYVAELIPTSPGHYRFRFFGEVEGNPVNMSFDSKAGGGDFDDVQTASVIHFPEKVASAREVEGAVRAAQSAAQQAQTEAMSAKDGVSGASTLGIIGIAVGAVGIALGGGALLISLRRRN